MRESIKGFSREGEAVMESSTAFVARQLGTESKPQRGRSLNAFSLAEWPKKAMEERRSWQSRATAEAVRESSTAFLARLLWSSKEASARQACE